MIRIKCLLGAAVDGLVLPEAITEGFDYIAEQFWNGSGGISNWRSTRGRSSGRSGRRDGVFVPWICMLSQGNSREIRSRWTKS